MPLPVRTALIAPALVALLLGAAACKGPTASESTTTITTASVFIDVADATPDQINEVADIVTDRLQALDLQRSEVGWDDASIEVIVEAEDEQLVRDALGPPGVLEFRPVLGLLAENPPPTTPAAQRSPGSSVVASSTDGTTYRLGPVELDGSAIESTTASQLPGGDWQVLPIFSTGAGGIDALNAVAERCYSGVPQCPVLEPNGRGLLAVVLDGVVLSAPAINATSFERDQIALSGGWSEREARVLAAAFGSGAAGVTWTVRD